MNSFCIDVSEEVQNRQRSTKYTCIRNRKYLLRSNEPLVVHQSGGQRAPLARPEVAQQLEALLVRLHLRHPTAVRRHSTPDRAPRSPRAALATLFRGVRVLVLRYLQIRSSVIYPVFLGIVQEGYKNFSGSKISIF